MLGRVKRQIRSPSFHNRGDDQTPLATVTSAGSTRTGNVTPSNRIPTRSISSTIGTMTPALRPARPLKRLERSASTARVTPNSRSGLPSRVPITKVAGTPRWSRKEICEKLAALEERMLDNSQATPMRHTAISTLANKSTSKAPMTGVASNQLIPGRQALTEISASFERELQKHNDVIETLKCEKMNLSNQLEDLQNELRQLKSCYESKNIELESVETRYQQLDSEHRTCKHDLDKQIAENDRVSSLLESQSSEVMRLSYKLERAIDERESAKGRVRENEARLRYLHNQVLELKGNIRVFARIRPLAEDESKPAVTAASDESLSVTKPNPRPGSRPIQVHFKFDRVLPAETSQAEAFEEVDHLVTSALDGYNVCIFAYGQTGSGKTYTMEGPPGLQFDDDSQTQDFGIIARALRRIFELTDERREFGWEFTLEVSFLEIYNESINDLLDRNKSKECNLRQTSDSKNGEAVLVENLITVSVKSVRQISQLMEKARRNRSVAATKCNDRSSRSHSIYRLRITAQNSIKDVHRQSMLNFVDLAGSERIKESGVEGARLTESKNINSSLTQLSTVLMSLGNKAAHIPYRNSKLTHLLSTSLGGNSKTLMFVNVSPAAEHVSETLNSLKLGQKVNEVHIGPASKNNRK